MKSFRYLITLFTLFGINFFVFNVSPINFSEESAPSSGLISLDLSNIDSKYFEITEFDEGPEAYKISPKRENEIDMITMGVDVIWIKDVGCKCLGITIYQTDVEEILFVIHIIENGVPHSLHYLKNGELVYIGAVEFLDLVNDQFVDREPNALRKLDLSDEYDKLFYFYVLKEHDNTSYERYEPYDEDEVFVNIVDGDNTIFETEIGCKYIEIYKMNGKYFLVEIHLNDGKTVFLRYKEEEGRLIRTTEKTFNMEIGHWGLRRFRYMQDTRYDYSFKNFTDLKAKRLRETSIDISLPNKKWDYTSISLLEDRFIVSKPIDPKVIKTVTDNGVVILNGHLENPSITHLKTSAGAYFLELSWSEGELRRPNLYFEKGAGDGIWKQITQKEFHDSFSAHVMASNPPSTIKYLDIDGLTSGHPIETLPEHIREKINSLTVPLDSVDQHESHVQPVIDVPDSSVVLVEDPSEAHDLSVNEPLISTKSPDKNSKVKVSKNPPKEHVGNLKSSFLWSSMNLTFVILGVSLVWG